MIAIRGDGTVALIARQPDLGTAMLVALICLSVMLLAARRIWPIAVGYHEAVRILAAWCELRKDFRSFRTDRVIEADYLDEKYPERRDVLRAMETKNADGWRTHHVATIRNARRSWYPEPVRAAELALAEAIAADLQRMLLPKDPNDGRNVFLEIRAGTGGDQEPRAGMAPSRGMLGMLIDSASVRRLLP